MTEAYRRHVASQPCEACGATDTQAAHLRVDVAGLSIKPSDDYVASLCIRCHDVADRRENVTQAEADKVWKRVALSMMTARARMWRHEQ